MSTNELINLLKFAQRQTFDVFCDRLALYRKMIEANGIDTMLRTCYNGLEVLEKAKICTDTANRLYIQYQMFVNLSILADIASEADLSHFDAEKLHKIYRSTIKTISGQIKPIYGENLCDLPLVEFNDLLRSCGKDDMRRAEYALIGVVRAYRMYQRVVKIC